MACIGKMRHRITIQVQSTTQNSYGEYPNTWTTFATVWASIEPMTNFGNRERITANEEHSRVDTKVYIRYLSGVLPKMRISYNSEIYDIKTVINFEQRNKEMLLMCEKVVS